VTAVLRLFQAMFARSSSDPAVLIVGAGPAGATAARTLALAGVHVRVLDRASFPRNKPCGGGISMRVLRRFPYLAAALPAIATHYLSRLYLEGPGGESTVIESENPAALMIRRVEYDALLVDLARDAGAEIVSGVDIVRAHQNGDGVTLAARDGRVFSAPAVIAADGVHSVVARRLGLNPGWPATSVALDMMEETPRAQLRDIDPSTLWVAYGFNPDGDPPVKQPAAGTRNVRRAADEGYAYIFPKRDHVNIGIGYVLSHYRRAIDRPPYELQRDFVRRLRERGIVEGASDRRHFTPFIIPVGGPLRRPGGGRVLLAGDAGGFVNGFTAEGIYYAMVTGDLAACAIVDAARGSGGADGSRGWWGASLVESYRRACDHEIGAELRDSVMLQRYLFADRRRIARVIDGARRAPDVTRLILDFAVGRMPYRALRRRMLLAAPALGVRFAWERLRQSGLRFRRGN
jgi:geranylgeranyl reductase family protein